MLARGLQIISQLYTTGYRASNYGHMLPQICFKCVASFTQLCKMTNPAFVSCVGLARGLQIVLQLHATANYFRSCGHMLPLICLRMFTSFTHLYKMTNHVFVSLAFLAKGPHIMFAISYESLDLNCFCGNIQIKAPMRNHSGTRTSTASTCSHTCLQGHGRMCFAMA